MKWMVTVALLSLLSRNETVFANVPEETRNSIIVLVTDAATKHVIENAQIDVEPGAYTAKTNAEGMAEIAVRKAGVCVLFVSASGYNRMQALRVIVTENQPTGISTSLRSNAFAEGADVESPSDGTYLPFMDILPSVKGGLRELARRVVYPEMAQQAGLEGTVYVRTYVSETGTAVKAVIEKSAVPILDRAALAAVMKVDFIPAVQNGRNMKSVITVPIKFYIGK